jgi:hypothetical protein
LILSTLELPHQPILPLLAYLALVLKLTSIVKSMLKLLLALLVQPTSGTMFLPEEDTLAVLGLATMAKAPQHVAVLPEFTLKDLKFFASVLPPTLILLSSPPSLPTLKSVLTAKPMVKISVVLLAPLPSGIMFLPEEDLSAVPMSPLVEEASLVAQMFLLPRVLIALLASETLELALKPSPGPKLIWVLLTMKNTEECVITLLVWLMVALLVVLNPLLFTGTLLLKDSDMLVTETHPQALLSSSDLECMVMLLFLLVAATLSPLILMALVLWLEVALPKLNPSGDLLILDGLLLISIMHNCWKINSTTFALLRWVKKFQDGILHN